MSPFSSFAKDHFVIKFNSSLPVTLEVTKQTSFNRYEMKIGKRKMGTKSYKSLKIGHRYWANFSQTNEALININHLLLKPALLQKEESFIELPSWKMIDDIFSNGVDFFHEWILNSLQNAQTQPEFLHFTSMLLALNEGIFHLPFKIDNRPFLLQYKNLNENLVHFYFAFDTLGAIKGEISDMLNIKVLYEKTSNILKDKSFGGKHTNISVDENAILPLWKGDNGLLDVKG